MSPSFKQPKLLESWVLENQRGGLLTLFVELVTDSIS